MDERGAVVIEKAGDYLLDVQWHPDGTQTVELWRLGDEHDMPLADPELVEFVINAPHL